MVSDFPSQAGSAAVKICAIAAMDEGRAIGVNNTIPWKLPEDMRRFASLTKGHSVLMGRKTWESLPPKFRPLPDRVNIVVSRTFAPAQPGKEAGGAIFYPSLPQALAAFRCGAVAAPGGTLWIIGGEQIYRETVNDWDELFLTRVHSTHQGDAFFPRFEESFQLVESERKDGFAFERYVRR